MPHEPTAMAVKQMQAVAPPTVGHQRRRCGPPRRRRSRADAGEMGGEEEQSRCVGEEHRRRSRADAPIRKEGCTGEMGGRGKA